MVPEQHAWSLKERKTEFAGIGMLIQLAAAICFFASIFLLTALPVPFDWIFAGGGGLFAGILFIVGSNKSVVFRCDRCRQKVDKMALVCPFCRSEFIPVGD